MEPNAEMTDDFIKAAKGSKTYCYDNRRYKDKNS
jgi:hypothetical protein